MKKIKLFLDASAISSIVEAEKPERVADMQALWEMIKQDEYDVVISSLVEDELDKIKDLPKKATIYSYLEQIDYISHEVNEEMNYLANLIIQRGILTQNDFNDCMHIACSMVTRCDCIVSYNFEDMVNIRTIKGVRSISLLEGYGDIDILTAASLIKKGANK